MIFVVAAVLWAAVLVPAWVRRREFKAAEQNAVRLQRTLRVLAETAEVPTEVRVEATAREALAQEKILRTAQRRQEAERQAKLAEARAAQVRAQIKAQQVKRKQAALVRSAKLRRPWVRRLRGFAALVSLLALATVLVGAGLAIAGLGFTVLIGASLGFAAAAGALVLMAPGRAKLVDIPAEHAADDRPSAVAAPAAAPAVSDAAAELAAAAHAAAQAEAAERLDRARAQARARAEARDRAAALEARAQSAIDRSVQGARTGAPGAAPAPVVQLPISEQLKQMGVVGDTREGMPDLDAALRRHRTAS